MEDWAGYAASLSDRQKEAQSYRWVLNICVVFAKGFPKPAHDAAFEFAKLKQPAIFEAFRQGKKRGDVLMELASEWAKAEETGGSYQ